jgi:CheY-like chemotaxis protein
MEHEMYKIVIATSRKNDFRDFGSVLEKADQVEDLIWAGTGVDALASASRITPDLIVIDDRLDDMDGVNLVRQLLGLNAMINTALVSPLSASAFHEATEGLGILNHLPPLPDVADARAVLAHLAEVVGS